MPFAATAARWPVLIAALFALLLAACGGDDYQVAAKSAPAISSFAATPAAQPAGGGVATLSWSVLNATTLTIDNGVGDVSGLASKAVTVTAGKTFTLTATNANGSVTATTAVTVAAQPAQPAPTITSFTATPASLPVGGGSVTLSWTTADATSLAIDNGVGTVTGTSQVVTVTADTTFTLTATNATGTANKTAGVTLATGTVRYIDVATGADTNPCTQAAPCKTLAKALTAPPAGSTIFLADGVYSRLTENNPNGSPVTVPDGITLQAVHPGAATLASLGVTVLGSATLNGLVIGTQGAAFQCGYVDARSTTGTPTLTLIGMFSNCVNWLQVRGKVQATMTPGALAGGAYTTGLAATGGQIAVGGPGAALLIQGGVFEGNNNASLAVGHLPLMTASGQGTLTLDGVTVRNWHQAVLGGTGGNLVLRGGTLIDKVGEPIGNRGNGCAVLVGAFGAAAHLTMDHATLSNAADAGICVTQNLDPAFTDTLQFTQSTISGSGGAAILSEFGAGFGAVITADALSLTHNAWGLYWFNRGGSFDIRNSSITGSTAVGGLGAGILFSGTQNASFKMRSSTVSGGAQDGVAMGGFVTMTVDLGTAADPGGNTFTGNATSGLLNGMASGQTLNAVGNTWTPNAQGADANGRYSVPPAFAPVPKVGPANGANYRTENASTLNL